jgi:prepilin-type processing-associated H-X9-DG protein
LALLPCNTSPTPVVHRGDRMSSIRPLTPWGYPMRTGKSNTCSAISTILASSAVPRPYETNLPYPNYAAPWYHNRSSNFLFDDGHIGRYRLGDQFDSQFRPRK